MKRRHALPFTLLLGLLALGLYAQAQETTPTVPRFNEIFIGGNVTLIEETYYTDERVFVTPQPTPTLHPLEEINGNRMTFASPQPIAGTDLLQWVEYDDGTMLVYILDEVSGDISLVYSYTCGGDYWDCVLDRVTTNAALVFPPDQFAITVLRPEPGYEGDSPPATLEIRTVDEVLLRIDERGRMPDVRWLGQDLIFVQNYELDGLFVDPYIFVSYFGAFVDLTTPDEPLAVYPLYHDPWRDVLSDVSVTQQTDDALSPDGRFLLTEREPFKRYLVDLVRVSYEPLQFSQPQPLFDVPPGFSLSLFWISDTRFRANLVEDGYVLRAEYIVEVSS